MFRLVVCAFVLGIACKGDHPPAPAASLVDPCAKASMEGSLAWIADDYPAAMACARAKHVPLVLDLWAPWCHTCLSMQTTVLVDPSFATDQARFVFAKLDTDRDQNARPMEKLAPSAWPTFYVIGNDDAVLARFVGAASVAQFHEFLDAGLAATKGGADAAGAHLLSAERALAVKDLATADTELEAGLAAAPQDWPRRAELLNSLVLTKYKLANYPGCIALTTNYLEQLGDAAVTSDFIATGTMCADADRRTDQASQDAIMILRNAAVARWKRLLAQSKQLSIDDRSDAMANLRETVEKLGDKPAARAIALEQRELLDRAAAKAPSPLAAMTYNWPRAEVYAYLGKPLDLVPALEKSAADLPNEYDPRARLGWLYLRAQDYPNAAKWTDQALAMVYGPRKGRLLALRAEIAAAQHDPATELKLREQAVALFDGLPKGQQSPESLEQARAALAKLRASGSGSGSSGSATR
jgi:thiol-disulfide isomerase/thioredoxin